MKKNIKLIELKPLEVKMVNNGWQSTRWVYTFESTDYYDTKTMTFCEYEFEPENMGEFRELNDISSKELLEWLIKNYKK
jgi:hypothetical protein